MDNNILFLGMIMIVVVLMLKSEKSEKFQGSANNSCVNKRFRGLRPGYRNAFCATCRKANGGWKRTCKTCGRLQQYANNNGNLVCQ